LISGFSFENLKVAIYQFYVAANSGMKVLIFRFKLFCKAHKDSWYFRAISAL
jgi:hypothetical protein